MLTASSIFWFTPIATGTLFLANVWLVAAKMWLIVGAVSVFDRWVKLGDTKPFRGPDGEVLLSSVAEARGNAAINGRPRKAKPKVSLQANRFWIETLTTR